MLLCALFSFTFISQLRRLSLAVPQSPPPLLSHPLIIPPSILYYFLISSHLKIMRRCPVDALRPVLVHHHARARCQVSHAHASARHVTKPITLLQCFLQWLPAPSVHAGHGKRSAFTMLRSSATAPTHFLGAVGSACSGGAGAQALRSLC